MCAVSNVMDSWTNPTSPNQVPWSPLMPTPATAQQMLEVIAKLEAIDKSLNAINCKLEASAKKKFKAKLKRRANRKRELRQ